MSTAKRARSLLTSQIRWDSRSALVGTQVVLDLIGGIRDRFATGGLEVHLHVVVVTEQAARGADLGTHVADRGHTRAGERLDTQALVLAGTT